jgi:hypothetical protein
MGMSRRYYTGDAKNNRSGMHMYTGTVEVGSGEAPLARVAIGRLEVAGGSKGECNAAGQEIGGGPLECPCRHAAAASKQNL